MVWSNLLAKSVLFFSFFFVESHQSFLAFGFLLGIFVFEVVLLEFLVETETLPLDDFVVSAVASEEEDETDQLDEETFEFEGLKTKEKGKGLERVRRRLTQTRMVLVASQMALKTLLTF